MPNHRVLSFDADSGFYHKRAVRSIDKADFLAALRNLRRALALDPDRTEYWLDLADTYARMGCYERSNLELQLLLHRPDVPPESLFGLGCNYMALGDYDQARNAFESYLSTDSEGEYVEQAEDALDQIHDADMEDGIEEKLEQLSNQGKAALDSGDVDRAIRCFERVLEQDGDLIYVRNNLALAYFCKGDLERAWAQLELVLKEDPLNAHGLCNAALLCRQQEREQDMVGYIFRLNVEDLEEPDELFKYCLTTAELGMERQLSQGLRKMLLLCPYDCSMLYLQGAYCFNQGRYGEAARSFERMLDVDPGNLMALTGANRARQALNGAPGEQMSYSFDYTAEQCAYIERTLAELIEQGEEAQARLRQEPIKGVIRAALMGEENVLARALFLLGSVGGPDAERLLRELLFSLTHGAYIKQVAMEALNTIGAPEPFFAWVDGRLVRMRQGQVNLNAMPPKAYAQLLSDAVSMLQKKYPGDEALQFVVQVWSTHVNAQEGNFQPLRSPKAWIAALDGLFQRRVLGREPDVEALALEAESTVRTVKMRMGRLEMELLEPSKEDEE